MITIKLCHRRGDQKTMKTETTTAAPTVGQQRLVRHRGGKWLWAWSIEAEEWNGCCATLEEAIEDAMKSREWDGVEADAPCYFAHGYKLPKSECDEWGLDWPWYQVERETALRIFMPNDQREGLATEADLRNTKDQ